MKVMIVGAGGFIGRHVCEVLSSDHEVIRTSAKQSVDGMEFLDLQYEDSILEVITKFSPNAVVSCAGIIANDENAQKNIIFTENLLSAIHHSGVAVKKIILSGSASVYGVVDRLPVSEDAPLNPVSVYGKAKAKEEQRAFELADMHGLPVVVARIFNPVGPGMNEQQLIPSLIRQVKAIKENKSTEIEVSRLDAERDYVDVRDVASAIKTLVENESKHTLYNVGTGRAVSIKRLIELILDSSHLYENVKLKETAKDSEVKVASQADITRIKTEYNWHPEIEISQTVKEIVYAANE